MKHKSLFRRSLVQIGLVGMLVLMCSVVARAQTFVNTYTQIVGNTTIPYIIVQAGGILDILPGATLNTDQIDIQFGGKVFANNARLNVANGAGTGQINLASTFILNEGAVLEMTNSEIFSTDGIWNGIFAAGNPLATSALSF